MSLSLHFASYSELQINKKIHYKDALDELLVILRATVLERVPFFPEIKNGENN